MKLRNKKTGMIGEVGYIANSSGEIIINNINDQDEWYTYKSLTELNEEWEDYNYDGWFIEIKNGTIEITRDLMLRNGVRNRYREWGLYFETKEEAEKAVEKLKAWKRLKDKGFTIDGWTATIGDDYYMPSDVVIKLNYNGDHRKPYLEDVGNDLDLLFGDEE